MHFVSMNKKYSSLKEALTPTDGLAVLGVFMEVTFYFKWLFRQRRGDIKTIQIQLETIFWRWVQCGFSYWESTAAILSICIQNFFVY